MGVIELFLLHEGETMADDTSRFHYTDVPFQSVSGSGGAVTVTVKAGLNLDKLKTFIVDSATDILINGQVVLPGNISGVVHQGDPISAEVSANTGKCLKLRSAPAGVIKWVGAVIYDHDPYVAGISDGTGTTLVVLSGPDKDVPQTFRVGPDARVTINGASASATAIPTLLHLNDQVTAHLQDGVCKTFTK